MAAMACSAAVTKVAGVAHREMGVPLLGIHLVDQRLNLRTQHESPRIHAGERRAHQNCCDQLASGHTDVVAVGAGLLLLRFVDLLLELVLQGLGIERRRARRPCCPRRRAPDPCRLFSELRSRSGRRRRRGSSEYPKALHTNACARGRTPGHPECRPPPGSRVSGSSLRIPGAIVVSTKQLEQVPRFLRRARHDGQRSSFRHQPLRDVAHLDHAALVVRQELGERQAQAQP